MSDAIDEVSHKPMSLQLDLAGMSCTVKYDKLLTKPRPLMKGIKVHWHTTHSLSLQF